MGMSSQVGLGWVDENAGHGSLGCNMTGRNLEPLLTPKDQTETLDIAELERTTLCISHGPSTSLVADVALYHLHPARSIHQDDCGRSSTVQTPDPVHRPPPKEGRGGDANTRQRVPSPSHGPCDWNGSTAQGRWKTLSTLYLREE